MLRGPMLTLSRGRDFGDFPALPSGAIWVGNADASMPWLGLDCMKLWLPTVFMAYGGVLTS